MVTTPAELTALDAARLDDLLNTHNEAQQHYTDLESWWDGKQAVKLTERMKQYLSAHGAEGVEFSDNYLDLVVESLTDRLHVAGFGVPGEAQVVDGEGAEQPGPLAQYAADTWAANRGDALQLAVHDAAVALGDGYVIVEWDAVAGRPALHFNDPRLIRMYYSHENAMQPEFATKIWTMAMPDGGKSVRMNVYHPGRIERWVRNGVIVGGQWRPFVGTDGLPAVIPWTLDGTTGGEPLGIAVKHFANNRRGNRPYGESELLPAIPLQRAINKALIDGLRVADAQGWPQRWATGVTTATDDLDAAPGSVWEVESDLAKLGQLEATDPKGAIEWLNKLQEDLAAVTRTPQHLFRITGAFPSGEAIKTAEAPLVKKAQKRQTLFGNSWEDVQLLAARLGVANGALTDVPPSTGYECLWDDAETRPAELDHIASINAKEGISRLQRWREYGYTDEEIQRMQEELSVEQDDLAEALDVALNLNGGRPGGARAPRTRSGD